MNRPTIGKAAFAGVVATLAMTILGMMGPSMGLPKMVVAGMLGSVLNGMQPVREGAGLWWAGMTWHFVNGALIFPLIYLYALYAFLPGPDWAKGATWGFILFLLAQGMVMPMMGMGFFASATPEPATMVTGSLIGHLIYGGLLGGIAGHEPIERRTDVIGHA